MAKLIRCPKCQSQIDVGSVPGGATVRCADCDALVRVPTGSTGVYPKVGAAGPAPAPAAPSKGDTRTRKAGGGRQTEIFKKMSGARSPGGSRAPSRGSGARRSGANHTPLLAGLSIGGVVLLGIALFFMVGHKDRERQTKIEAAQARNAAIKKQNEATMKRAYEEHLADEEEFKRQEAAQKAGQKKDGPQLSKKAGGGYDIPPSFEPGAAKQVKGGFEPLKNDPALTKEYETMAAAGRAADIVRDIAKWMPYVVMGLIHDDAGVARGSYQALHDFCAAKGIQTDSGANPVKLEYFNSSIIRGSDFSFWSEWWGKPQNRIAIGAGTAKDAEEIRTKGEDPSKIDWDEAMKYLRAGGGFDDPTRPEGKWYARLQAMGRGAYPYLIKYIPHEDLALGKAAVTVLNALTSRQSPMPTEANKEQMKNEWENWFKNN
jgi:hypothetical protein